MKLPRGEETLPIAEVDGKYLTAAELESQQPVKYRQLLVAPIVTVSDNLLVERFSMRVAQGRVLTIYRADLPTSLTPEEQLMHIKAKDKIGMELINAEAKLLQEELRLLRE
jgi:hypothetical protein